MKLRLSTRGLRRTVSAVAATAFLASSLAMAAPAFASKGPTTIDRNEAIERARVWTDKRVPYSQVGYKDGYRRDCSGFVSMAWNLPVNLVTWNIPLVAKRIGKSDLKPGDVLLNDRGGAGGRHVVVFEKWANEERTEYWGLEQTGETDDAVRRVLPYPYRIDKGLYKPYRFKGMDGYWKEIPKRDRQMVKGWKDPELAKKQAADKQAAEAAQRKAVAQKRTAEEVAAKTAEAQRVIERSVAEQAAKRASTIETYGRLLLGPVPIWVENHLARVVPVTAAP